MLMPKITQILDGKDTSDRNQTNELSTLKALIILYSHATASPSTPRDSGTTHTESIPYWRLKSLVEVYALRLSLHKSVYDLQIDLQSERSKPITETTSYQKYTYWLQLFVMAK
jgi:hypothetical protein